MPRPPSPSPSLRSDPSGRSLRLRTAGASLLVSFGLSMIVPPALCRPAQAHPVPASLRIGAPEMRLPHTGSLLVDYYEAFLRDQKIDKFRLNVSARYNEGTLCRLLHSGEPQARRASVLALGLFGGFGSNAEVARSLKDTDPTVRTLADNALWAIWFRADSRENNTTLERIHNMINRGQYAGAIEESTQLVGRAPSFAEAYNQRAIAHYFLGEFAESQTDCELVLKHNPFHIGALSGMGQCQIRMGKIDQAIQTYRRALEIQPFNDGIRGLIADLEAGNR